MSKVLFQWVDGGDLRQFLVDKNSEEYRILMAVISEVDASLDNNAAVTGPEASLTKADQVAAAGSPLIGPLKTASEGKTPSLKKFVCTEGWSHKKRNWATKVFRGLQRANPDASEEALKELFMDKIATWRE